MVRKRKLRKDEYEEVNLSSKRMDGERKIKRKGKDRYIFGP